MSNHNNQGSVNGLAILLRQANSEVDQAQPKTYIGCAREIDLPPQGKTVFSYVSLIELLPLKGEKLYFARKKCGAWVKITFNEKANVFHPPITETKFVHEFCS